MGKQSWKARFRRSEKPTGSSLSVKTEQESCKHSPRGQLHEASLEARRAQSEFETHADSEFIELGARASSPALKPSAERLSRRLSPGVKTASMSLRKFASERMPSFLESMSAEEKHASTDFEKVARRAQKSMKCVPRQVNGHTYSKTFLAREILSWLIAKRVCSNHNEAIFACQQFLELGLITRVGRTEPRFTCDLNPYQFSV
mmetsp:Transcript_4003/g.8828  ORF Transcript_4003/g.8828 Transcript_4003/m.8828 type:complete len:203 (-) Transcript_4003:169-777(-)